MSLDLIYYFTWMQLIATAALVVVDFSFGVDMENKWKGVRVFIVMVPVWGRVLNWW